MANARKISITTESREIFIISGIEGGNLLEHCSGCANTVEMLTLDQAVVVADMPARELIRQIESGAVHSMETASGHLLVCEASLFGTGSSSKAAS